MKRRVNGRIYGRNNYANLDGRNGTDRIERTDLVRMKRLVNGRIYGRSRWILTDGIERTDLVRMKRRVNERI